ncbi:MAG: hypothetical protein WCT99_06825 [Bacteroidota bacterium]|jgi:hypothetical protein
MRLPLRHFPFIVSFVLLSSVIFLSCEDPLPPYIPPQKNLQGIFVSHDETTVLFATGYWGSTPFTSYDYDPIKPETFRGYTVTFGIKNIYEETFQGKVNIQGKIEIWPEGFPDDKSTLSITKEMIMTGSSFDPITSVATMNPNSVLYIESKVKFQTDNGKFFNQFAAVENIQDGKWTKSIYYRPLSVVARMSVQLFDNLEPVSIEQKFFITFQARYYKEPA